VPKFITEQYQSNQNSLEISKNITLRQCQDLYDNDIRDFHFYSLNKADLLIDICKKLQWL
jgi:5,10-methylenetetrahydrofolate reductase